MNETKGIAWFSRHPFSEMQIKALKTIFGEEISSNVKMFSETFKEFSQFEDKVKESIDEGFFPFIVTSAPWLLKLASQGIDFGTFEIEPSARIKGTFELKRVWKHFTCERGKFHTEIIYKNTEQDKGGDLLKPVR